MPLSRLPSLSALRAFEAAARLSSFKAAAGELSVTPGAISQQIRALEDELGVILFDRAPRRVTLTGAGRDLMPDVTDGFMRIRDAVDRVRGPCEKQIKICAAGMVIRNWLLPRLHKFSTAHPMVQTQMRALHSWEDFDFGENEVAVRLSAAPPEGVYARKIHRLLLVPVASPAFIEQHAITGPEDALRLPLLQDVVIQLFGGKPGWDRWFEAAGLPGPVPPYAMTYDPYSADYALDMALSGDGVMLGWSIQCYHALADGRLRSPFGPVLELDMHYYLMCNKSDAEKEHIRAFIDWAAEEAALLSTLWSLQKNAA